METIANIVGLIGIVVVVVLSLYMLYGLYGLAWPRSPADQAVHMDMDTWAPTSYAAPGLSAAAAANRDQATAYLRGVADGAESGRQAAAATPIAPVGRYPHVYDAVMALINTGRLDLDPTSTTFGEELGDRLDAGAYSAHTTTSYIGEVPPNAHSLQSEFDENYEQYCERQRTQLAHHLELIAQGADDPLVHDVINNTCPPELRQSEEGRRALQQRVDETRRNAAILKGRQPRKIRLK